MARSQWRRQILALGLLAVLTSPTDATSPVPGQQMPTTLPVFSKLLSEASSRKRLENKKSLVQTGSSSRRFLNAPYKNLWNTMQGKTSDDAETDPNAAADWVISTLVCINAAVTIARTDFQKEPPNIDGGLKSLKIELWKCVHDHLMDESEITPVDSAVVNDMHSAWLNTWNILPQLYEDLTTALEDSNSTGIWTFATESLNTMMELMVDIAPAMEVYVDAVSNLIGGLVNATSEISTDSAAAFNSSYSSMMNFFKFVTNDTYADDLKDFTDAAASITELLQTWQNAVTDSALCYRDVIHRRAVSPSICDSGFTLIGDHCVPDTSHGLDCESECPDSSVPCSFCPPGQHCCKEGGTGPCSNAVFFDRDYTAGSPADYFQCVQPVSILMEMHQEHSASASQAANNEQVQKLAAESKAKSEVKSKVVSTPPGAAEALMGTQQGNCFFGICSSSSRRRTAPNGQHQPWCDHWGDFNSESDGLCVERCPEGYVETNNAHECAQQCGDKFPDEGVLKLGLTETVSVFSTGVCATHEVKVGQSNTGLILGLKNVLISVSGLLAPDITSEVVTEFGEVLKTFALNFAAPRCSFADLGFSELENS